MTLYNAGTALAQRTMAITLVIFLEQNHDTITVYLAGRDSHWNAITKGIYNHGYIILACRGQLYVLLAASILANKYTFLPLSSHT